MSIWRNPGVLAALAAALLFGAGTPVAIDLRIGVAACNRNTLDLQSKVFSTCNQQD